MNSGWTPDLFDVPPEEGKTRFHDFALPEPLLHAIADLGFRYCTPIQSAALPFSLADYDITGQAQTGTGKTAAFLITIFTRLVEDTPPTPRRPGRPRALVLAPTRELALQIDKDARGLGRYLHLGILSVVGGMNFDRQQAFLENEVTDLLIATPGRLIDFINRGTVDLRQVEVLVIDEADRMLDMGFIPDVRRIVYRTPQKKLRQTLFFSATFSADVLHLARQWTLEPEHVAIQPERLAVDSIDQHVFLTSDRDKFRVLYNLTQREDVVRALVFTNRRDVAHNVAERLYSLGVECEVLAGDVPQRKRLSTLERFRSGEIPVVVATDVAGRGIHVEGISHVVNYNLPEDAEDYVHRIGRTGRAGASGTSISLVSESDAFDLPQISTLLGIQLVCEQPDPDLLAPLPAPVEGRRPPPRETVPRPGGGGGGGRRDARRGGSRPRR
jgi:ATP-dependent RNA helicase RhlB